MIKYFVKKGIKVKQRTGNSAPSYSTVAKWTIELKFGWESLDDDRRSGWPKTATTP